MRKPIENNIIKDNIYKLTKSSFYEYGYQKVTLKDIAKELGIQPSLITYYFKSKDNLVTLIYEEFWNKIHERIDSYKELNINSALLRELVFSYINYDIILNDANNKRFYKEINSMNYSNYVYHRKISDQIYWSIIKEFNLTITNQEFLIYSEMRTSSRAAFIRLYFKENFNFNCLDIVGYVESIAPKQFGIDPVIFNDYLIKCSHVVKVIDYSDIKYLI